MDAKVSSRPKSFTYAIRRENNDITSDQRASLIKFI